MNHMNVADDLIIASEHASLPPSSSILAANDSTGNTATTEVNAAVHSEDTVMEDAFIPNNNNPHQADGNEIVTATIKNESQPKEMDVALSGTSKDATSTSIEVNSPKAALKAEEAGAKDALDAALAGKNADGYESSDIELSSDEEDAEDSSSDTSSSSEDEDDEVPKRSLDEDEMDFSEDESGNATNGVVKTVHEITHIEVEKPKYELTPQTEIIFAGNIYQMIDNVIVVQSRPHSEHTTLDQGSLLVYEDKRILGEIFETFGPVKRPYYSIRFNSVEEREKEPCKRDDPIYYVPAYEKTRIVELEKLKQMKGSDASNRFDEEPDADEMEFSDDEKERQYKAKLKREKNKKKTVRKPPAIRQMQHYDHDKGSAGLPYGEPLPARQQRSYADLLDEYDSLSTEQQQQPPQQYLPQARQYPSPVQPHQYPQQQHGTGQQFKSADDILSALFGPKASGTSADQGTANAATQGTASMSHVAQQSKTTAQQKSASESMSPQTYLSKPQAQLQEAPHAATLNAGEVLSQPQKAGHEASTISAAIDGGNSLTADKATSVTAADATVAKDALKISANPESAPRRKMKLIRPPRMSEIEAATARALELGKNPKDIYNDEFLPECFAPASP